MGKLATYFRLKFDQLPGKRSDNIKKAVKQTRYCATMIRGLLDGKTSPSIENLPRMVDFLGLDYDKAFDLWRQDRTKRAKQRRSIKESPLVYPDSKPVPLIDLCYAGDWVEYNSENPPEEWLARPVELINRRGQAFKVEGDSMFCTLRPGWIVFVDFDRKPYTGDIAVVSFRSGENMIREVEKRDADSYHLRPANHAYECSDVGKAELKHICKVVNIKPL